MEGRNPNGTFKSGHSLPFCANRTSFRSGQVGSSHPAWKGGVDPERHYRRFHNKVRKEKGSPKKCELCGQDDSRKRYEWANLTGDYDNPQEYKRMCISCHRHYDANRKKNGDFCHKKAEMEASNGFRC